ncbi:MAG: NADP-dependent oxidoreductase [Myxococcota bacterium]|nr:NADP-dependent oxidoreductase [Myxococcota bacterium]
MKAAQLHAYGEPLSLDQVPEPLLGPSDVLVQVHASSVNPIDVKVRAGGQRGALRYKLPWIQGMDLSGVVLSVGEQVTTFKPGDAVYGSPSATRPGCWAERAVVDHSQLALKPRNLDHVQAATLPLVGLTAWQCLLPALTERPNPLVFIQAGAGGVGSFAIQLAAHHGAFVSTTASPAKHALLQGLGAQRCIDYRTQRYDELLPPQDIVLDALGGPEQARAFTVLKRGGHLASIVTWLPQNTARYGPILGLGASAAGVVSFHARGLLKGINTAQVIKKPLGHQLAEITALVEQGAIKPVIDAVYPLEDINQAMDHVASGRSTGKVAVQLR